MGALKTGMLYGVGRVVGLLIVVMLSSARELTK